MAVSKMGRRYTPTPNFKPGGHKGKLHRELGISEGKKIPPGRLVPRRTPRAQRFAATQFAPRP